MIKASEYSHVLDSVMKKRNLDLPIHDPFLH